MTKIAFLSGWAVTSRLTLRNHIIMTNRTTAQNRGVIDRRYWTPGHHAMTGIALVGTANMTGVLSRSDHAIVAGRTASQYVVMIHHRRRPPISVMTILTKLGRADVIRRFSGCSAAVMTLRAPGDHSRV